MKFSNSIVICGLSSNIIKRLNGCIVDSLGHLINRCRLSMIVCYQTYLNCQEQSRYIKQEISLVLEDIDQALSLLSFQRSLKLSFNSRFCCYLNQSDIIYNEQFGFTNQLLMNECSCKKGNVQFLKQGLYKTTFCGLSNGFDCVEHDVLQDKLFYYGVSKKACHCFGQFQ